jgi:acyl carrier protein
LGRANEIYRNSSMVSLEEIKAIIGDVLQIADRMDDLGIDDPLLGGVPEFDSMAVVAILTTIEDNYGVMIDDDEVSAEHFESIASLLEFVNSKVD